MCVCVLVYDRVLSLSRSYFSTVSLALFFFFSFLFVLCVCQRVRVSSLFFMCVCTSYMHVSSHFCLKCPDCLYVLKVMRALDFYFSLIALVYITCNLVGKEGDACTLMCRTTVHPASNENNPKEKTKIAKRHSAIGSVHANRHTNQRCSNAKGHESDPASVRLLTGLAHIELPSKHSAIKLKG